VRQILRITVCLALLSVLATVNGRPVAAQGRVDLLPEQSAAKARTILQQVISALGGRAFLDVRDSDCNGRVVQFGHNGESMGNTQFREVWLLPAKYRMEYIVKGQHTILGYVTGADTLIIMKGGALITVFDGDQGWVLDKAGVSGQPESVVKSFTEQLKSGMNNMLRSRMNEDGVEFRYAGTDLVDMKEVEWIEISDRDRRALRMAVEKSTHLPLRWVVTKRDPETRERTETVTSYTQFIPVDGVQTPFSITRTQNGRQISQTFLTGCKYNSNISAELFTPASLKQGSSQAGKNDNKNSKPKK
jgi:hypothetical protein